MPMDDNGTIRMNKDFSVDAFRKIIVELDSTLSSFTSQLNGLKDVVGGFRKDYARANKSAFSGSGRSTVHRTDWNRNFQDADFKEIAKVIAQSLTKEAANEIPKRIKEANDNLARVISNAQLQEESLTKKENERYAVEIENKKRSLRNKKKLDKALERAEIDHNNNIQKIRQETQNIVKEWTEDTTQTVKQLEAELEQDNKQKEEALKKLQSGAKSVLENAHSFNKSSSYLSMRTMFSDKDKTEAEQLAEVKDKQLELYNEALAAIKQVLSSDADISKEQREELEKQEKQLERNIKLTQSWTYTGEVFAKAGKDLATAGKNIINNLGRNIMKTVEDKYLSSYKEGFQNVYNSIESTRNTVSARLKLDQGGYSTLQEEIQAEIQAQGLESTVSQIDVNNAIAELSAAGVTDKEMLKTLALEQAKLAASGSSLNLGNEETLNNIRQFVSSQMAQDKTQEEALDELRKTFAGIESAESYYAAQGWTSPFVNGGANLFYNASMNRAILGNWTGETATRDIQTSAAIGDALSNTGLDPQFINSIIEKFSNSTTDQLSTYLKAMKVDNDILQDVLSGEYDPEELQKTIISSFQEMLTEFSRGDTEYLTNVLEALQMDINAKEAALLMKKPIDVNVDYEGMAKALAKDESAIKQADYLSETEKHQKKTENTMANLAKNAEKQYKGNEYVIAGMDAVEQGINAIAETAQDILSTLVSDGVKGLFGSGTGGAVGSGLASAGGAGLGSAGGLAAGLAIDAVLIAAAYQFIGKPLMEGIEDGVDYVEEATQEYKKSMDEQAKKSNDQLEEEQATLDRYKKILESGNTAEMKIALREEANLTAEQLMNDSEENIQDLFKQNLLDEQQNLVEQKKLQAQLAEVLKEDAQYFADTAQSFNGIAFGQYGKDWEQMNESERSQFLEENRMAFAGRLSTKGIADVGKQLESVTSLTGSDLDAYLLTSGIDARGMTEKEKQAAAKQLKLSEISTSAGFGGEASALLANEMELYYIRKGIYDQSNEKFKNRWSLAESEAARKNNTSSPTQDQIYFAYLDMYYKDSLPEGGLDIAKDENGVYQLVPGDLYKDSYKFRTGFTNVPYDNYPAMLHKGERILTAAEADAYNEMSSYAVSNLVNQNRTYGNSSNVFNTNSYGVSGFESSIDKQTNSLASILNQILTVLKTLSVGTSSGTMSAAHRNVLLRNSSVSQINTLS
ncbi:MAG: hypothetical protein J6V44_15465 [Methanobrevibacter sp.]|nr:hypothetical protein [Methanobrevibacter sp.]